MDIIKFLLSTNVITQKQIDDYEVIEHAEKMKPKLASTYLSEKLVGVPSGKVFTDEQRNKYYKIMEELKKIDYVDYKEKIDELMRK